MNLDDAKETFLLESRELLEEMESALLRIEETPDDEDAVNAVFRAAHTIKGSSGVFGFDEVQALTHIVESVLDRLRAGELGVDGDLVALLLTSRDRIGVLVESAVAGTPRDEGDEAVCEQLRAGLNRYLDADAAPALPVESVAEVVQDDAPRVATDNWHISLRFAPDALRNGLDPLALLRYLGRLGDLVNVTTLLDALPQLDEFDPESCYLGLEIDLRSDAERAEIDDVFEFFREDARIQILPPNAKIDAYIALIDSLPEENLRLGEILIQGGALTAAELEQALKHQAQSGAGTESERPRLGELLVEERAVPQPVVEAAAAKQERSRQSAERTARSIRIDAEKLDTLINLVGELVIAGATTNLLAQRLGDEGLRESTSVMSRLVEEIRDSALRLRMVQVGDTFNRFQRVVRDVSRELQKDIHLEINGGETELDKTVVEKIGDPLMHLVRNAMDHGIEPADQRAEAGKPLRGAVTLNAYHDSGSIVIEVSDDGRGLNAGRILEKAREKGLVAPGQEPTTQEIYRLIFEPGFSTAEQITNLSGRGVGMDVVKRNIEALRGTVDVTSEPGHGTTFTIRLPLTLAIIDGFLVGVGGSSYVIPLDMVVECIEVDEGQTQTAASESHYINLRGEVLPYLRLHELFAETGVGTGRENIVVVQFGAQKAGLVVDELLGEFQTVIKPLGKIFRKLAGVSGATILGSGEVAVILDVPQLIHTASTGGSRVGTLEAPSTTVH